MDPDPLSIFALFYSSRILFVFDFFNTTLIVICLLVFAMLVVLNAFSLTLKKVEADELKNLEKSEPRIFEKLQSLFNRNKSMSTLFSVVKIIITITLCGSLFALLQNFAINFFINNATIALVLICCFWLLPIWVSKYDNSSIKYGINFSMPLLSILTPLSNLLAPNEAEFPQDDVSLEDIQTALPETLDAKPTAANLGLYKQVLGV